MHILLHVQTHPPTGSAAHKSEAWLETVWEGIDTSVDLLLEELGALLQSAPAGSNMGQVLQQLAELHVLIPGGLTKSFGSWLALLHCSCCRLNGFLQAAGKAACSDIRR
jgi:hypothetical protein